MEDQITIDGRYKYLRKVQARYRKVSCIEKKALLDKVVWITVCRRKSLIRLMNGTVRRPPRRTQREQTLWRTQGRLYRAAITHVPAATAEGFDYIAEFINQYIARFWQDLITAIHLTRDRLCHTNDKCFVEQENNTTSISLPYSGRLARWS